MTDQARGELVPGGLAMILGGRKRKLNVGKVVELLRLVIGPAKVSINDGVNWIEVPTGYRAWVVTGDGLTGEMTHTGRLVSTRELIYAEKRLMPINPEADPLSIDQRQECKA